MLTLLTYSTVAVAMLVVTYAVFFTDFRQLPPVPGGLERGGREAGARPGCPGGQTPRPQRPPPDLGPHHGWGQRLRGPRIVQWFFFFIMSQFVVAVVFNKGFFPGILQLLSRA